MLEKCRHVLKMSPRRHSTCRLTTPEHQMSATCHADIIDILTTCRQRQDMSSNFSLRRHDTTPTFPTKRTAAGDVLDFNAQCLDAVHNAPHHVNAVRIQDEQRHDGGVYRVLPGDKNLVDPHDHHGFIHPGLLLAGVDAFLWVCFEFFLLNSSTCFPLENQHRVQQLSTCGHHRC